MLTLALFPAGSLLISAALQNEVLSILFVGIFTEKKSLSSPRVGAR